MTGKIIKNHHHHTNPNIITMRINIFMHIVRMKRIYMKVLMYIIKIKRTYENIFRFMLFNAIINIIIFLILIGVIAMFGGMGKNF